MSLSKATPEGRANRLRKAGVLRQNYNIAKKQFLRKGGMAKRVAKQVTKMRTRL